jgi:hypothetical protein
MTGPGIGRYALTKPFYALPCEAVKRALEEAVHYQCNFTNALNLLKLPGGSRILDLAYYLRFLLCGWAGPAGLAIVPFSSCGGPAGTQKS